MHQQRAVLWQQSPPPSWLNDLVCKEGAEIVTYLMLFPLCWQCFDSKGFFIRSDSWMTPSKHFQREAVKGRLSLQKSCQGSSYVPTEQLTNSLFAFRCKAGWVLQVNTGEQACLTLISECIQSPVSEYRFESALSCRRICWIWTSFSKQEMLKMFLYLLQAQKEDPRAFSLCFPVYCAGSKGSRIESVHARQP